MGELMQAIEQARPCALTARDNLGSLKLALLSYDSAYMKGFAERGE